MDKEILGMLVLLPGSIISALLLSNPVATTLAIMITLFYSVQIIGSITIYLHKNVDPAFIPLTICYVCSAVGGTWLLGGLLPILFGITLVPKIFILYLAGQSALAIAQGSDYIIQFEDQNAEKFFKYNILILIGGIEMFVGTLFTDYSLTTIVSVYLMGVATLKTAEWFDKWIYQKHQREGTTYLEREENIAILIFTVIILTWLYMVIL